MLHGFQYKFALFRQGSKGKSELSKQRKKTPYIHKLLQKLTKISMSHIKGTHLRKEVNI